MPECRPALVGEVRHHRSCDLDEDFRGFAEGKGEIRNGVLVRLDRGTDCIGGFIDVRDATIEAQLLNVFTDPRERRVRGLANSGGGVSELRGLCGAGFCADLGKLVRNTIEALHEA